MPDSISKPFVTPRELAESLDLSESSIKRWADEGRISVGRTMGGHRRIAIAEAIRFIRESGLPIIHPDRLGLSGVSSGGATPDITATVDTALHHFLVEGQAEEARRLVLGEFLSGRPIAAIADQLIAPSMETIGKLWKRDVDGIFVEHRATEICAQCVRLLVSYLAPAPASAPVALGASPSGDIHSLTTLLASAVLREQGYNTINLGPETPLEVMDVALGSYHPSILWIAVTMRPGRNGAGPFVQGVRKLTREMNGWGGQVVLGGRAVPQELRKSRVANLRVFDTMTRLQEFAVELRKTARN